MSDSEEENFCFYGTALEPYDEDSFPKKRPITVEEQIATDQQGRRRFHGAFTGGFSAGFFNTVGSLEGWTPSEFKSSRDEKASTKLQNPEDYMDDEDFSEFGIAPQTVKATKDYAKSKKRKKQVWSDGPIPGEPVLETLINSGNETIGYMLLKNMSLADKRANKHSEETDKKVYGCEMPKMYEIDKNQEDADPIPAIYKEYLKTPKSNTFGLGYVGLDKSHINLFHSTNLVVKRNNNKKLTISGQAFGVGAFEEDDEDIYVKEDMEKYDFELTSENTSKNVSKMQGETVFDSFVRSKTKFENSMFYPPPVIPHSFTGKHNIRKSRFEPIAESTNEKEPKQINASIRAKYLGEITEEEVVYTPSKSAVKSHKTLDENKTKTDDASKLNGPKKSSEENKNIGGFLFDRFVSASQPEDPSNILEPVKRTETEHGTKEMRDAARMKMFGPLTRTYLDWTPCSLLCKRFNVPEPNQSDMSSQKNKKRTKNLIFEYQKHEEKTVLMPGLTTVQSTTTSVVSTSDSADLKNDEENKTVDVEQSRQDLIIEEKPKKINIISDLTIPPPKNETNKEPPPSKINLDITEKINVSENTDLFKAIFLSDSESDKEEETKEEQKVQENEKYDRNQVIKENILASELVPKIKPKKDGILSNVDYTQFTSVTESKKSEDVAEVSSKRLNEDSSVFGPRLPEKIYKSVSVIPSVTVDDQWVEKDEVSKKSKSHKHKHKNKKEKHKDKTKVKKKHKHKH